MGRNKKHAAESPTTVSIFTKYKFRYIRGNKGVMRTKEARTFCPLMQTQVGSDKCYFCDHNIRKKPNLNLPPWTIECKKKDEIQFDHET